MGTTTQDEELVAKQRILRILEKLKPEMREEVSAWVMRRFGQDAAREEYHT